MGQDPFQVLAKRLHEIRDLLKGSPEAGSISTNVEIEARLGLIVAWDDGDKQSLRRTGPFLPGAGAIELLQDQMNQRKFLSGVSKKEFELYRTIEEGRAGNKKNLVSHAYTYPNSDHTRSRVQVDEPGGKPKRERKVGFRQFQVHLPSCPYDCRITVSFESPEDADLSDVPPGWESHRTKRRTSFLASRLPNGITSRWQADLTHVTTEDSGRRAAEGAGAEAPADTYEVEFELGAAHCTEWLRAADAEATAQHTPVIAQDLWERISTLMPREQTAGTLTEVKSVELELAARRACVRPFRGDEVDRLDMERLEFPGTMPVGFSRRMLERCQRERYLVSEKTDGVRYLLAVAPGEGARPTAVLLDRRFKAFTMPGMEELGEALGAGTVIDGEIVRNRSWKRDVFMCFDLLAAPGEPRAGEPRVVELSLERRLERLQRAVLQHYLKFLHGRGEAVSKDMKLLPLVMKHFYPTAKVHHVLRHIGAEGPDRVYLERDARGQPLEPFKRHHKSDGLIFAPNLPYHCGTDYNYFKWKWHDTITLDFEAHRVQVSPRTPHGVAVSFASQDGRVDFTEHIMLSAIDRCRLLGDIGTRTIITEWEYSPAESAWVYKMPRPDKKTSNFARTVLSTMMELAEAMDVEEVEYRLSFARPEDDDWEAQAKARRVEMVRARKEQSANEAADAAARKRKREGDAAH